VSATPNWSNLAFIASSLSNIFSYIEGRKINDLEDDDRYLKFVYEDWLSSRLSFKTD
jgi:hypothetical protein